MSVRAEMLWLTESGTEKRALKFTRLVSGTASIELFFVQRGDRHYVLRWAADTSLSFNLLAAGSKQEMSRRYKLAVANDLKGTGLHSLPYEVETTRIDAKGKMHLDHFDHPMVGTKWEHGTKGDSDEEQFMRMLAQQVKDWKGSSNPLNILRHQFWPKFRKKFTLAVAAKYGPKVTVFRGMHGTPAKQAIAREPVSMREYSSWADSLNGAKAYRKGRIWAVIKGSFPASRVVLAPVTIPGIADPNVLMPFATDVEHVGDELIIHTGNLLPPSDYSVALQTRAK